MRAITVHEMEFSNPSVQTELRWSEVATPEPGPGQVLIKVAATAVNRADLLQRQGLYPPPSGASPILGLECSGTVVSAGSGVNSALIGAKVCALLDGGGYAEYAVAHHSLVLLLPDSFSEIAAAAIPESLATSWLNLFSVGKLSAGETVLIQGGSSGIGTTAIQLARLAGCRIIASASTQQKRLACLALGADMAMDYNSTDFAKDILDWTNGKGPDVILDNVGPSNLDLYAEFLAVAGRVLVIGSQGGRTGTVNAGPLMAKQARIFMTSLRRTPHEEKVELFSRLRAVAWRAICSAEILPVIDSVHTFQEAESAHERMTGGSHIGKVVISSNRQETDRYRGVHPISRITTEGR